MAPYELSNDSLTITKDATSNTGVTYTYTSTSNDTEKELSKEEILGMLRKAEARYNRTKKIQDKSEIIRLNKLLRETL